MGNEKIVRTTVYPGQQPTEAMIRKNEAAANRQIVQDEDAPELTTVQNLGDAYQWTSASSVTGGTLYESYEAFYDAMKGAEAGEANGISIH